MMPSGVEQFCCLLSVCTGLRKSAESLSEGDFLTQVSRGLLVLERASPCLRPSACQPPGGKICPLSQSHFLSPLHPRLTPSLPDRYGREHMFNYRPNRALMPWQSWSFGFFFCHWFLVLDKDYRLSRLHKLLELLYLLCDLSL